MSYPQNGPPPPRSQIYDQHRYDQEMLRQQQIQQENAILNSQKEEFERRQFELQESKERIYEVLNDRTYVNYPVEFKVTATFTGSLSDMQRVSKEKNFTLQTLFHESSLPKCARPTPAQYLDEHHIQLNMIDISKEFNPEHLLVQNVTLLEVHNTTHHRVAIRSQFAPMNNVSVLASKETDCAVVIHANTPSQRCNELVYYGEVAAGSSMARAYAHTTLQEMFSAPNVEQRNRMYEVKAGSVTEQMVVSANDVRNMKLDYPFILSKKQLDDVRQHAYNSTYRYIPFLKNPEATEDPKKKTPPLTGFTAIIPTGKGSANGSFTDSLPGHPPLSPEELNKWHSFGATFHFQCIYPYSPAEALKRMVANKSTS